MIVSFIFVEMFSAICFRLAGICGYSSTGELEQEVGSAFHAEMTHPTAAAVASMMNAIRPRFALSIEAGGVFMR